MTDRERQDLRERIEADVRKAHPEARKIVVNVCHTGGPVVEIWGPKGSGAKVGRYEGLAW